MPKRRNKERIICEHYVWLLGQRGAVYTADGRSNQPSLGRHSLGTKNYDEALEALRQLDLVKAVEAGKADRSVLEHESPGALDLTEGWDLYRTHVMRPRITGGAKSATAKRYRTVFDKFLQFVQQRGISSWNAVTRSTLEAYAAWLDDESYSYATEYLELTTLKQANKWLIENGHLPADCRIVGLRMTKPTGTDTYCWTPSEVEALIDRCREQTDLHWLGDVLTALACTGLRISELAALRWPDVDLQKKVIVLTDESTRAPRRTRRKRREIKNRRSRSFPIHAELQAVLRRLPHRAAGRIFHGPRGGMLKPDTVRRILIRDVLTPLAEQFPTPEGEIGFIDGRLHSFRHYFCSACANAGVPEQVVMQWLGHQSSRMVRHYYHLHDEEAQRQMQRLELVNTNKTGRKRSAG